MENSFADGLYKNNVSCRSNHFVSFSILQNYAKYPLLSR